MLFLEILWKTVDFGVELCYTYIVFVCSSPVAWECEETEDVLDGSLGYTGSLAVY